MKKVFFLFISFAFQICLLHGEPCMKDIKELLKAEECDLESYPAPWELLYPESCKQIKQIINTSFDICVKVLVDEEISSLQKKIFLNILAYDVDFDLYTDLLSYSMDLYLNGELDFRIFEYMFVNPNIKYIMKKQYKSKEIRNIVKACLNSELSREEVQFFKSLKKGKF